MKEGFEERFNAATKHLIEKHEKRTPSGLELFGIFSEFLFFVGDTTDGDPEDEARIFFFEDWRCA